MASKDFISLLFSTKTLQIVKLDSDKKKLQKAYSAPLPEGIIKDYVVIDQAKLSQHIKLSFAQAKTSEKNVGIIVPEFSTYTKLLELPGLLKNNELDEAVRWQAKEFLPSNEKDIVMDWKLLSAQMDKNQVLMAAIDRNVLTGYVDAVSMAGLYPLVVETQSLALSRVAAQEGISSLLLYNNFGETVLTLLSGLRILGSSVVRSDDTVVSSTANEMVKHYAQGSIHKIIVCGSGFSEQFYAKLKSHLNVAIEGTKNPFVDLPDQKYQEFLIPISQQMQDPFEPRDERSVNLLPPAWIKKYSFKKLSTRIWSLLVTSSVVMWSCLAVVVINYFVLNSKLTKLNEVDDVPSQEVQQTLAQVESTNKRLLSIKAISDSIVLPQVVINNITSSKPEGVAVAKYSLDLDKGIIKIDGLAQNRDNLINFKTNLEKFEEFSNVRIPIPTLAEETNINYSITFEYTGLGENKPLKLKINSKETNFKYALINK